MYPADSLTAVGTINGHLVKYMSARWLVRFHTGHELDESDFQDIRALFERFGIDYPA